MSPNCAEKVTPAQLRVLLALVAVYERDGRATVRDVQRQAGLASPNTTDAHLRRLRRDGFATWADGRSGTLRPLVRRVGVRA